MPQAMIQGTWHLILGSTAQSGTYLTTDLKASRVPWSQQLNVARDCVLADPRLHPGLIELQAHLIDGDPGLVVIDAGKDEVHTALATDGVDQGVCVRA